MASNVLLSSFASLLGDYIGTESCLDLENSEEVVGLGHDDEISNSCCSVKKEAEEKEKETMVTTKKNKKKEFPPPISLLARTENLASHMPWILKRYYTNDGRLILKEEKVRHHEYMKAHRANGRLTLQLVPLDDDHVMDSPPPPPPSPFCDEFFGTNIEDRGDQGDEDDNIEGTSCAIDQKNDSVDVVVDHEFAKDINKSLNIENAEGVAAMGANNANGAPKCLNFNTISSSPSCIFRVPLPAIRTVHS
ncbi:protein FANTASTIC FOUR 1-like [Quillaja saponaria]|uniref:Protein FANTASTIC FOUR 1-like n=1 Tax=Quillaja saponaria TaxID=32244 RepID=A0AAD7LWJ5_QUISA|nr:protein FANTASTIC FOUR 1-like [Quillaja saponaria]